MISPIFPADYPLRKKVVVVAISAGSRRKEIGCFFVSLHFLPHAPYMGMELDRAQRLLGKNAEIQEERGRSPVRACTQLRRNKTPKSLL